MNQHTRSRLMVTGSMAIFGTLGIFTRYITVSSGELALYRAVMAALLITVFLALSGKWLDLKAIKKELPLLLFSGIAMGFNWILLFEAYRHTTISIATLSYYFAPVLVMALSPILFREKLSGKQILCFVMSTLGLVLIIGVGSAGGSITGILFGLGAACLYATVILLNKFIKNVAGLHRTVLQFYAAILVLLPYVLCSGGMHPEVLDGTGWLCLIVVGVVHTFIAYCLYFSAIKDIPGQEAAILSYVDPLVAVLVSVLILSEGIAPLQIVGGALVLGFTLWNELGNTKK